MNYPAAVEAALRSGNVHMDAAAYFDFKTEPMRLWTGNTDIYISTNTNKPQVKEKFRGIGDIARISGIGTSTGGGLAAEEVQFELFGGERLFENFKSDSAESLDRAVTLYELFFDKDTAELIFSRIMFDGTMGPLTAARIPGNGELDPPKRSIQMPAVNIFANRNRPALQYWADRDQRARSGSTDDYIFVRVSEYATGTTVGWPVFP